MKILALESSAVACSAALCEDEKLIAQVYQNNGLTHSVTLMPMTTSLLSGCGVSLEEVDLIAVAAGPGSFTGLRIGVAAAKGRRGRRQGAGLAGQQALRPLLHPGVHGLEPGPHRIGNLRRHGRPAESGL